MSNAMNNEFSQHPKPSLGALGEGPTLRDLGLNIPLTDIPLSEAKLRGMATTTGEDVRALTNEEDMSFKSLDEEAAIDGDSLFGDLDFSVDTAPTDASILALDSLDFSEGSSEFNQLSPFEGFMESLDMPMEDTPASRITTIPIIEIVDSMKYYIEHKKGELSEYKELITDYSRVHVASTSVSLANDLTRGKGSSAVSSLMPLLVDQYNLRIDFSTPEGRSSAALLLACHTIVYQVDSHPVSSRTVRMLKDKESATELMNLFNSVGSTQEVFDRLLSNKSLASMYHVWLSSFSSISRIETAGQAVLKTKQFREMIGIAKQIQHELDELEVAFKDVSHITYPSLIETQPLPGSNIYKFTCGHCGESVDISKPFYNLNLLDKNIVAAFQSSKTPPSRVTNLAVVFRSHTCPSCNYCNIVSAEFGKHLTTNILERMKQGPLSSKNSEPYSMGMADVSQSVIQAVTESIQEEDPQALNYLPEYTTSTADANSELLSLGDILPEWELYKDKYWKIVRGAYKLDTFSQDNNKRFYGYIAWLSDKYPNRKYSIQQPQIISYLIKTVLNSEELSKISADYDKHSMCYYTSKKLIRVLEDMFSPLWGSELISTEFAKQGLKVLESYGYEYDDPDWYLGLSISQSILETPQTLALSEWLSQIAESSRYNLNLVRDKLASYLVANPILNPVEYDSVPAVQNGAIPEGILSIMASHCYDTLLINTMSHIIFADINCGLFMRGFGVVCTTMKDFVKQARVIINQLTSAMVDDESGRIREIQSKLSKSSECPEDIIALLIQLIRSIDNNDLFKVVVGIPVNHLKVDNIQMGLKVPDEPTALLRKLFTYNSEYKIVPASIIDIGLSDAVTYLASLNIEDADEDSQTDVVYTVAKEMSLLDDPELWRTQSRLLESINSLVE